MLHFFNLDEPQQHKTYLQMSALESSSSDPIEKPTKKHQKTTRHTPHAISKLRDSVDGGRGFEASGFNLDHETPKSPPKRAIALHMEGLLLAEQSHATC